MLFGITLQKLSASEVAMVKALEQESGLSPWSETDYLREIERPGSVTLIAKYNEIVIGFLVARLITTESNVPLFEAEILNIGVQSRFRNNGIGTSLIKELFRITNISKAYLEVRETNAAGIAFYESNQFKSVGKRRNFYVHPTEDAIVMCRNFEAE